jgi:hypothetical protein
MSEQTHHAGSHRDERDVPGRLRRRRQSEASGASREALEQDGGDVVQDGVGKGALGGQQRVLLLAREQPEVFGDERLHVSDRVSPVRGSLFERKVLLDGDGGLAVEVLEDDAIVGVELCTAESVYAVSGQGKAHPAVLIGGEGELVPRERRVGGARLLLCVDPELPCALQAEVEGRRERGADDLAAVGVEVVLEDAVASARAAVGLLGLLLDLDGPRCDDRVPNDGVLCEVFGSSASWTERQADTHVERRIDGLIAAARTLCELQMSSC